MGGETRSVTTAGGLGSSHDWLPSAGMTEDPRRARRTVYRNVRRSLERDALLAAAGERLAQAVESSLAQPGGADLVAALADYRRAAAQASGPTST